MVQQMRALGPGLLRGHASFMARSCLPYPEVSWGIKGTTKQILIRFPRQASAQPDLDYHTLSSAQRTCDSGKISPHFAFALGVDTAAACLSANAPKFPAPMRTMLQTLLNVLFKCSEMGV